MRCQNVDESFEKISAYFNSEKTGKFFIVNAENYDVYHDILKRLQADGGKKCVYVSKNLFPNNLPDIDSAIMKVVGNGSYVLIDVSQALMLRSDREVESKLAELLAQSISGFCVVILEHCQEFLKKFLHRDNRLERRVILVEGETSGLPKILLAKDKSEYGGSKDFDDFGEFLNFMEQVKESQLVGNAEITVASKFSAEKFSRAVYPIRAAMGMYELLQQKDNDIANFMQKNFGTETQWRWLKIEIFSLGNFNKAVCKHFGTTANLSMNISKTAASTDENIKWLFWLALKVFGESNNDYLTLVLNNCAAYQDFESRLYLNMADIEITAPNFKKLYDERRNLISRLPQNISLIDKYCDRLGKYEKNAIFYLTDLSEKEEFEFMQCLSNYDYSDAEITRAVNNFSKNLSLYMQDFIFDFINTKLPESEFSFTQELTKYFKEYKLQKLTNRIHENFLNLVNQYALSRPYNKLQPRSNILSHIDKNKSQLFFFDALGAEYLSFILEKCKEYGLSAEIYIGRCELPSITSNNKDFFQYFNSEDCFKIEELDNVKHHSQKYDYQQCKFPLHLFRELEIIDNELQKIQSRLLQETAEKIFMVSDHGASRLAVIYGQELNSAIAMEENGEHSGRCCKTENNPEISFAAYENGFSILANYERFKGGRKANVEVHGGATLEEMLIPIILITKLQADIEINFTNPTVILKLPNVPEITIYANIPLQEPRLCVNGEIYIGELGADNKHAKFKLTKIKRKGKYFADFYCGNKKFPAPLEFKVERQTREVEFFLV